MEPRLVRGLPGVHVLHGHPIAADRDGQRRTRHRGRRVRDPGRGSGRVRMGPPGRSRRPGAGGGDRRWRPRGRRPPFARRLELRPARHGAVRSGARDGRRGSREPGATRRGGVRGMEQARRPPDAPGAGLDRRGPGCGPTGARSLRRRHQARRDRRSRDPSAVCLRDGPARRVGMAGAGASRRRHRTVRVRPVVQHLRRQPDVDHGPASSPTRWGCRWPCSPSGSWLAGSPPAGTAYSGPLSSP